MQQKRKFGPPSPGDRAMAGLRPASATRLGVDVQPARMRANSSKPATPSSKSLLTNHHSPIPRTRVIKGVLGGRSATCPERSRGNSDITDQREALPACAGPSAQAFTGECAARSIMYEMSSDHHPPITAVLIDTPAIRIALNSIPCSAGAHSNRHSSGAPTLTSHLLHLLYSRPQRYAPSHAEFHLFPTAFLIFRPQKATTDGA